MAGILDLLNSDLGKSIIGGIANTSGTDTSKTSSVLSMGLPILMKAMQQNSSSEEGAEKLLGALTKKHDGSILNNLEGVFNGGVDKEITEDGGKILNHVLGNKTSNIEQFIGQKVGIDSSSVSSILKIATPILMGLLGKQTRENNVSKGTDLNNLIGGLLGGSSTQQEQNFLEKILDQDGDGSVIDDVAGMVLNSKTGKDLMGGVFNSFLGK